MIEKLLAILGVIFFAVLLAGSCRVPGPIWHDEGNDEA
jgi:hypothetical protein